MLTVDEIKILKEAGYSLSEIMEAGNIGSVAASKNTVENPAENSTENTGKNAVENSGKNTAENSSENKSGESGAELSDAIKDLTALLRSGNISGVEFPDPETPDDVANKYIANIINPPKNKKEVY